MKVLETERLVLRRLTHDDAGFMLGLLNESAFLRYIGDRGVRSVADAREYLSAGPIKSYDEFGHGMWMTERKDGTPVGICGLVRRAELDDVDVGFAFLPAYRSMGYATESAAAVSAYAREVLGLDRLVAIVQPDNVASIRVIEKIGLRFERHIRLSGDADEICLYARDLRDMPETSGTGSGSTHPWQAPWKVSLI